MICSYGVRIISGAGHRDEVTHSVGIIWKAGVCQEWLFAGKDEQNPLRRIQSQPLIQALKLTVTALGITPENESIQRLDRPSPRPSPNG